MNTTRLPKFLALRSQSQYVSKEGAGREANLNLWLCFSVICCLTHFVFHHANNNNNKDLIPTGAVSLEVSMQIQKV